MALLAVAVCAAGLLLSACADPGALPEAPAAATTTWTALIAGPLSGCSGCHGTSSPPNGLSVTAGAYSSLFTTSSIACPGDKFVTSGDKTHSSLYLVILPTGGCTGTLTSMLGFQSVTLAAEIGAWIDAGAPQ